MAGAVADKVPAKMYKASYALLIGASKYQDTAWRELPGVMDDLAAVEPALRAQGFEVTKIINPTSAELTLAFRNFISRHGQDPDNRLLLYLAGHGHTLKPSYGGVMGYFVPVDAPSAADVAAFQSAAVPMEQIEIFAKQINAKHALFVFDACFAGTIFVPQRASAVTLDWSIVGKPVRQFLTSGSAEETVPDRSKFRERFVAAIGGEADLNGDGYVTGNELGAYISQSFSNSKRSTTPQFGPLDFSPLKQGDFVFVPPGAARAVKSVAAPSEPAYQMPAALTEAISLLSGMGGRTDKPRAKQLFIDASSGGDALATMWIARNYWLGSCNFQQSEDDAKKIAKTVIALVKELAEKGDTEAMFLLGDAYYAGLGVERDYTQAVFWLRKAIAKGHPFAMNNLGVMYFDGEGVPKDHAQALTLYRLAAEKGFTTAISNVGAMYKDGAGVPKDYGQALSYFTKAADRGGMLGMYNLGELYLKGLGVKKDIGQAIMWYTRAAEHGHNYSLLVLARLYRDGREVDLDMTQAVKWYEKSAETGNTEAIEELAFLYLDGAEGMTKDASQVIPLFRRLAAKGIPGGLVFLGWAYENGKGVTPDPVRASLYYQQAADKGDKYSMARLGQFHYDGKILPQDFAKAEKFYRQALDSGIPLAEIGLGQMYENGKGVPRNLQQAIALYSKLAYPTGIYLNVDAQFGNSLAQFSLGRIYELESEIRDLTLSFRWYRKAALQGNKEAMQRLASFYEEGKGIEKNPQFAEMWRRNIKGTPKRFTVPCDWKGEKTPFHIIIVDEYPPDEDNPIREEAERILLEHNAKMPAEVTDSFKRLLKIARDNKVSFTELCVYALGQAGKKKEEPKK